MYRIPESVRSTQTQDGAIILAIHTGQVLRLNTTGSLIFERLKDGVTESEIIDSISQQFGVSSTIATQDVREFLKELEELGLLCRRFPDQALKV